MTELAANSWVACPKPRPSARLRLFCLPYAGGGAWSFRAWTDYFSSNVEVCLIELPGRGMRLGEPTLTRIEPLVEAIAQALLPHLDKPFACFGHSMGGLLGFELVRYLRRNHGFSPIHLLISGHRAPQVPAPNPPIHALPDPALREKLRHLNGTPAAVLNHPELMQLFLPVLRADFAIVETYRYSPEPPLKCPLTVLGGLQDPEVHPDDLRAWQNQTTAAFTLKLFPGDHFFLHSDQLHLLQYLAQALG